MSFLRRLAAGTFSMRFPFVRRFAMVSSVSFGRVCLRLSAAFRHRLGEVREQDREPQPEGDLSREERPPPPAASSWMKPIVVRGCRLHDEHDRVLIRIRDQAFAKESTTA